MNKNWYLNKTTSLPNLNVLVVDNVEVGFITKPNNDSFTKNMWRIFKGKGETCQFLGHIATKNQAKRVLEKIVFGY